MGDVLPCERSAILGRDEFFAYWGRNSNKIFLATRPRTNFLVDLRRASTFVGPAGRRRIRGPAGPHQGPAAAGRYGNFNASFVLGVPG
eukprot:239407-Hanusia_phi.AAC.1